MADNKEQTNRKESEEVQDNMYDEENEGERSGGDNGNNPLIGDENIRESEIHPEEGASDLQDEEKSDQSGFGRVINFLQEHVPVWAHNFFFSLINLIGRTFRTLAFGYESAPKEMADSFGRTMDAERFKAEQPERQKQEAEKAKEHAKEMKQEAEASQKNRDRKENNQEKEKRDSKTNEGTKGKNTDKQKEAIPSSRSDKETAKEEKVPESVTLNIDTSVKEIRYRTVEEQARDPYGNLFLAGFTVTLDPEQKRVLVEDMDKNTYYFSEGDSRLKDKDTVKACFRSATFMGLPQGSHMPEVPEGFGAMINSGMADVFERFGLIQSANEAGDRVYVFEKGEDGTADINKCWTLSQSSLYLGDATDYKKILYEIENKEKLHQNDSLPSDVRAASEAAGLVSALRGSFMDFADREVIAAAQIETADEKERVEAVMSFPDETEEQDAGGNCKLVYHNNEALLKAEIMDHFASSLEITAEDLGSTGNPIRSEIDLNRLLLKEADEQERAIGVTMVCADDMGEPPEAEELPPPIEDTEYDITELGEYLEESREIPTPYLEEEYLDL